MTNKRTKAAVSSMAQARSPNDIILAFDWKSPPKLMSSESGKRIIQLEFVR